MSYKGPQPFPFFVPPGALLPGSVNFGSLDPAIQTAFGKLRNRIINGDCRVQQYGGPVIFAPGSGGYGGVDRWAVNNTGPAGSGTISQQASAVSFGGVNRPVVAQVVTSSGNSSFSVSGLRQVIEGLNSFDLIGQPIVLSFIFSTNLSGLYSVAVRDGTSTQSFLASFNAVSGVPQRVILQIPELPSNLVIPSSNAAGIQINIGSFTASIGQPSNSWQVGNYITAAGATNWSLVSGTFIQIGEVQLESGSIVTPFERRPFGMELSLCQRYYEVDNNQLSILWNGNATSGIGYFTMTRFMVVKRAIPTITYVNSSYQNMGGLIAGNNNGINGFQTFATATATANSSWFASAWNASAEL